LTNEVLHNNVHEVNLAKIFSSFEIIVQAIKLANEKKIPRYCDWRKC